MGNADFCVSDGELKIRRIWDRAAEIGFLDGE
jgi:hypothetical protein